MYCFSRESPMIDDLLTSLILRRQKHKDDYVKVVSCWNKLKYIVLYFAQYVTVNITRWTLKYWFFSRCITACGRCFSYLRWDIKIVIYKWIEIHQMKQLLKTRAITHLWGLTSNIASTYLQNRRCCIIHSNWKVWTDSLSFNWVISETTLASINGYQISLIKIPI